MNIPASAIIAIARWHRDMARDTYRMAFNAKTENWRAACVRRMRVHHAAFITLKELAEPMKRIRGEPESHVGATKRVVHGLQLVRSRLTFDEQTLALLVAQEHLIRQSKGAREMQLRIQVWFTVMQRGMRLSGE